MSAGALAAGKIFGESQKLLLLPLVVYPSKPTQPYPLVNAKLKKKKRKRGFGFYLRFLRNTAAAATTTMMTAAAAMM